MKKAFLVLLFFSSINLTGQINSIKLYEELREDYKSVKPSVLINRDDPKKLIIAGGFGKVYLSIDSGATWQTRQIHSSKGFYGDPLLLNGRKGEIFYLHFFDPRVSETASDRIYIHHSEDGGFNWESYFYNGLNGSKTQVDYRAVYNRRHREIYLTWSQFDKLGSNNPEHESNIMFSSSRNGRKWSDPVAINRIPGNCLNDDLSVKGAYPIVTNEGRLFVAYAYNKKLFMDRSYDRGDMWLRNDIEIADQTGGWKHEIPGWENANGLPSMAVDNSLSVFAGNIYVAWSDLRNGTDNSDIFIVRSGKGGDYWTRPERVNNDQTASHQFLPVMTVDDANGMLYLLYYDKRSGQGDETDIYLAYSIDAGVNFTEIKLNKEPFTPSKVKLSGSTLSIDAYFGKVVPVWTQVDEEGNVSLWTSVINFLKVYEDKGEVKEKDK